MALTFDDGPTDATSLLLDILASRGVNATFFVVGSMVHKRWDVLKRAYDEGHLIASHSFSHSDFATLDAATIRDELANADYAISQAACIRTRLFRPPYGSLTAEGQALVEDLGYKVVLWDLDTRDWALSHDLKPEEMLAAVRHDIRTLDPGGIIHLQHDLTEASVALVPAVIDIALEEGYRFVSVDECVYGKEGERSAAAEASLAFTRGECAPPTYKQLSPPEVYEELLGFVALRSKTRHVALALGEVATVPLDMQLPDSVATNVDFTFAWRLSSYPE
eukprot:CAMPEP_0203820508 /NCGR_PEP_ID=MMETSP0115-20131106/40147_1 /ASSEMBLY_ACC=CAM_ASM_000227 /TAXON_ID=33651 /ORGANISM="Bicosoecid sp, Strain ms1" /LENGTH=277 /DNA_ID=CAMNT_0050729519 /DNA_START=90 /DNA_END=920 /DNA_ORIENTATION=+